MTSCTSSAGDPSAPATPDELRRVLRAFSHDIRGALTPIALWVHLALDPTIPEERRLAHLQTIAGLVKRMETFVSTLPGLLAIEGPPVDDRGL